MDDKISVLLEEHRALRNEIEQHHVSMRYMTLFNLTASGAIFSYVWLDIGNSSLNSILLVVPILSAILGSIFFFHSKRMSQLGLYIRDVIAPKVRQLQKDDSLLQWEKYVREKETKNKFYKLISLDLIRIFTFFATSVIALLFSFSVDNFLLWLLGLLLTIMLVFLAYYERKAWLGEDEE